MTVGRYAMRGQVFQPWVFAGQALADRVIAPSPLIPPVFVACQVSKHANVTFHTKADGVVAGVVK